MNTKKAGVYLGSGLIFFLTIFFVVFILAKRDRSLAKRVAIDTAIGIARDAKERKKYRIPADVELVLNQPGDSDLFRKRWHFWFELAPRGAILIEIDALRGLPFLPLANSRESLVVHSVAYSE